MTIASDLLQQHIQTLVDDNARWQTLIADDILWELAYAPSLGHPAQLAGRKEAVRHATWFVGAVENFRFFDLNIYALAYVQGAVAEELWRTRRPLQNVWQHFPIGCLASSSPLWCWILSRQPRQR